MARTVGKAAGRMRRAVLLGLTLGCMAGIFLLSAQPVDQSAQTSAQVIVHLLRLAAPGFDTLEPQAQAALVEAWQTGVRTLAHFSEYACLGLLLRLLLHAFGCPRPLPGSWGGAVLYALLDEFHQAFVPGRTCDLMDVAIDAAGAALGVALAALGLRLARRIRNKGR